MEIPIYQVDAFASRVFRGNPAAVCPLSEWLPDHVLQSIAMENNLSETAYFVGSRGRYKLRWMTPETEVDLCGHATLASAYVIFSRLEPDLDLVRFETASGELVVKREGERLSMDFPSRPPTVCDVHPQLAAALGGNIVEVLASRDYLVVYETEAEVRKLTPDMRALMHLDRFAVIVTAPGESVDFVSRFFAPRAGVPEDPVTGSAHSTLIPYWAARLGKQKLTALQVSKRGGELWCEHRGDRVTIAGQAVEFMQGTIRV